MIGILSTTFVNCFRGIWKVNIAAGREIDLDVVRGIAILLAMGWHFNRATAYTGLNVILWPGSAFGWAGVDLFFVLSGFLVGRLVFREIEKSGKFDTKRFFLRRALKLWPTLYLFLLAMLLYANWRDYFFQIGLHLQNYIRTPVATHLWSLAVEEHFYFLFALLFPPLVRRSDRHHRILMQVLIGVMVASLLLRVVAAMFGGSAIAIQTETHFRLDALSCGVFMAALSVYQPAVFGKLVERKVFFAILVILGVVFLANVPKDSKTGETLGYTVSYLASASVLLLVYRSGVERVVPRLSRAVALAGVYSYAIYIWHVPAGRVVEKVLARLSVHDAAILIFAQYVSAILAGVIATRVLERPILVLRDRLLPAPVRAVGASGEGAEAEASSSAIVAPLR